MDRHFHNKKTIAEPPVIYLLEEQAPFCQSVLWDWQKFYYEQQGVTPWRHGALPHYVTSNPSVARSYAEMVLAFIRDCRSLNRETSVDEPFTIIELGAGHGRFSYHFLKQFTALLEETGLSTRAFRYVMTDVSQQNLGFWRTHPHLQPFYESGMLDMAFWDVETSDSLNLQINGTSISPGDLSHPAIVIANYVFDSIPQDLWYVERGQCRRCLVSLLIDENPAELEFGDILERLYLHVDYETDEVEEKCYGNQELDNLMAFYRDQLLDTHLLLPASGITCMQRLSALSKNGMMLLTADKGDHELDYLQGQPAPGLVAHGGCFSINVNYHAFKLFCENSGGKALFPDYRFRSVNHGCLLLVQDPSMYVETTRAYNQHIQQHSPDDFYLLSKYIGSHGEDLTVQEIISLLRYGSYDAILFLRHLHKLLQEVDGMSRDERKEIKICVERVWNHYFPLGENPDLAFEIAGFLYALNEYEHALLYLERSQALYGKHCGTLMNMALCHAELERHEQAKALLAEIILYEPFNEAAASLLAEYE